MVVRRSDRRRRLISEEYTSASSAPQSAAGDKQQKRTAETASKRAYAIGADRHSQLQTTDLFPKRIWVIVALGALVIACALVLNLLAFYAPQWKPYIGDRGVAMLGLTGAGTLTSWLNCILLLIAAVASLQIYALRKHRCDDYGGTYRVWMWLPPVFLLCSVAAVADLGGVVEHVARLAFTDVVSQHAMLIMIAKLGILAAIVVRFLFEVRESKAAFAMLLLAWGITAVSTAAATPEIESRFSQSELVAHQLQQLQSAQPQLNGRLGHFFHGNLGLLASVTMLMTQLFYTRFVYCHAHGMIVQKQKPIAKTKPVAKTKTAAAKTKTAKTKPAAAKTKPAAAKTKPAAAKTKPAAAKAKPAAKTKTAAKLEPAAKAKPAVSKSKAAAKRPANTQSSSSDKSSVAKSKTAPQPQVTVRAQPAAEPPASSSPNSGKKTENRGATTTDFATLLKQKQEAEKAALCEPVGGETDDQGILKMSKSERRKARKAKRANRRAA